MRHLDLFSGIGGFALAARWVWGKNHRVVCFVETNEFCRRVLAKHWPTAPRHGDIHTYHPPKEKMIDLVTGGFPCQPFSASGKRRGREDDRYLWPEMRRVIEEARPRAVLAENVAAIDDGLALNEILSDLETLDYEVWPLEIPAIAVDSPHLRRRLWLLAHANGQRQPQSQGGQIRRWPDDGCKNLG